MLYDCVILYFDLANCVSCTSSILFYACTATFNYCSCTIVEDVRNGAQPVLQGSQPTVDMVNDNQVFGNPRYACMIT